MKRLTLIALLFSALSATTQAQYFPIDTARLNNAYRTLTNGERTAENEMEFLEAYPTTWLEFYMTYSYVYDEEYDIGMSQLCTEHITTLFGLSHINDTVKCKKIVDLTIGMKESGEYTGVYQDYLIGYILNNEVLVLDYLSKLKKGHQMEFWQFCWSTATECSRAEDFNEIYNRLKNRFPKEMEISRAAFQYFYDGINYPNLLPHKESEYCRKFIDRNYKEIFNGYLDSNVQWINTQN